MRLRNKETGEICDFKIIADYDDCTSGWRLEKHDGTVLFYDHIDEIHKEWEDYEGPKEYWYIDTSMMEVTYNSLGAESDVEEFNKEIGNYFETREEAEKAVEKLRAWKRLKDKGFRFDGWSSIDGISYKVSDDFYDSNDLIPGYIRDDLDLLFGGEE